MPVIEAPGKQVPAHKLPDAAKQLKVKIDRGWRCVEGELDVMQLKQCGARRGTFYADRKEDEKNCGFCCVNGDVDSIHPKNCSAKRQNK